MSIYVNDKSAQLFDALYSITEQQSEKPDAVLVMIDGPVGPDLEDVLSRFKKECVVPLMIRRIAVNQGLSKTLADGVRELAEEFEYIVRHDADDISRPNRIQIQIQEMEMNASWGCSSGQVSIFVGSPSAIRGQRRIPPEIDMREFAKTRTPINHSCSILRSAAMQTVMYPNTRLPFEDWWLSLRLLKAGWKIGVTDIVLMDFRGGEEMISRRHGFIYAAQEREFLRLALKEKLMTWQSYLRNLCVRSVMRTLPKPVLLWLYRSKMHR